MGWGTGNLGGGSGGLNFKIVSYATESELLADTPKENTIGVITSIPITGYHFGTEEPSPAAAGMVWITTGTSSAIEFNALKKNAIQVYPLSAKQHDGSAWVDVTAKSYQGGEWVDWFDGKLYENGSVFFPYSCTKGTATENNDHILLTGALDSQGNGTCEIIYSDIVLDGFSQLEIGYSNKNAGTATVKIGSGADWMNDVVATLTLNSTSATQTLDVSEITGLYKIRLAIYTASGKPTMKLIRLRLVR